MSGSDQKELISPILKVKLMAGDIHEFINFSNVTKEHLKYTFQTRSQNTINFLNKINGKPIESPKKMILYLIHNGKEKPLMKDGSWFEELFLPIIDKRCKIYKLDDYWNAIEQCLLYNKKIKNIKVYNKEYGDFRYTYFRVKDDNNLLVFTIGNVKQEYLKEIYRCDQNPGGERPNNISATKIEEYPYSLDINIEED